MSTVQKYSAPNLRFRDEQGKDYPDWEKKKLHTVLDYLQPTPYLVGSTDYDDANEIPVLTAGKTFLLGYTSEKTGVFEKLPAIIFDDFTTAFQYVNFPFKAKSSAMKILVPANSDVNLKFVYESMSRIHFPLGEHKRYWISEYQREKIQYPCKEEQQKIAAFLSAVDTKIEQLNRKKSLLEQYKKGMMQKLFSREIRFKDEDRRDYPDWEVKKLGDISNVKRGASPRPITSPLWFDENSSIGWVRISDVTRSNKYLTKTEQYLSRAGVSKSRFVPKGNMIMSICATIGKPVYTAFDVCIHDGFVVFDGLEVSKEFIYYILEKIQKRWYRYGQPGTQVNLTSDIVSNEQIKVPVAQEQQKIANFLSAIDRKIELVADQIEQASVFKQGLLQQMFI